MFKTKKLFLSTVKVSVVVIGAMIMAVSLVFAATTIGTNINTNGTLSTTGLATFTTATSTSATTTAYLYIGPDITEPTAGWDFSYGDLIVSDDAFFNSQATTSVSFWVGSGGTPNNLSMSGGDLYVQDDLEVDGGAWIDSATTTDSLKIGGYASTTGDLIVNGDTIYNGTTTATTTIGLFSDAHNNSTSTVSVGKISGNQGDLVTGCIEMVNSAGTYSRAILDGAAWNVSIGRCN